MNPKTKDVFIIHSKGDPIENALTERVLDTLLRLGISVYEYDDWTWSRRQPGKVRYHWAATQMDLIRLVMGNPEPFRRQTWEEVVDRDVLEEMLAGSRVVLFIAPRGGTMSPGVREEYTTLPHDSNVMLATWGEQNDWLVEDNRHTYLYKVPNPLRPDAQKCALDLVHLVWLHWTVDFLAREGRGAGYDLLTILAQQGPATLRMIKFSGRVPKALRQRMNALGELEPDEEAEEIAALGHSLTAVDARPATACLWKQIEDLDAVLAIPELPTIVIGPARLDRGVIRGEVGDAEGEIADFTGVLGLKGVPDEVRIKAHFNRGIARKDQGDRLGAIQDFVVVRDDPQSPVDAVRGANRYLTALDSGDADE